MAGELEKTSAQNAQQQRDRQDESWRSEHTGMLTPAHHILHRRAVTKHPSAWAYPHTHQSGTGQPHMQLLRFIIWAWMLMHTPL